MIYKRYLYFVEGKCEEQFVNALKLEPRKLVPGKVKVHNVIQDIIPRVEVNKIQPGTTVVFIFDTDIEITDILKKNIAYVKKYTSQVKLAFLAEVLNFEDELVRATDIKKAKDLTKSSSNKDFKSDFCKMKPVECRNALERHHIDISKMWCQEPPNPFLFIKQNPATVRV